MNHRRCDIAASAVGPPWLSGWDTVPVRHGARVRFLDGDPISDFSQKLAVIIHKQNAGVSKMKTITLSIWDMLNT